MRRTGPNDDRRVVWALGELFLSFFRLFLILTKDLNYLQVLITKCTTGWAGTTRTGPNDARHVVWALGKFYYAFFCY